MTTNRLTHQYYGDANPKLIDVRTVSQQLQISEKTVRRMADLHRLPGMVRLGRLLRFDQASINKWIGAGCPNTRGGR